MLGLPISTGEIANLIKSSERATEASERQAAALERVADALEEISEQLGSRAPERQTTLT